VLGDWAHVWTTLTITVTQKSGESPVTRAGPTLSILQKNHGKWVIVRDANMLAVVPG
jgi:ketosteroid isomerase-like protein